jgi:hypothetical protein
MTSANRNTKAGKKAQEFTYYGFSSEPDGLAFRVVTATEKEFPTARRAAETDNPPADMILWVRGEIVNDDGKTHGELLKAKV